MIEAINLVFDLPFFSSLPALRGGQSGRQACKGGDMGWFGLHH
ncbi:MAG: hypothetical protein V1799_00260 [bacterium]